jgi:hypothetical protein
MNIEALLQRQVDLLEAIHSGQGMHPELLLQPPAASYGNFLAKQVRYKHDPPTGAPYMGIIPTDHRPLYEHAFFQDCSLDPAVINTLVQPSYTLLNLLPVERTIYDEEKFGFLTGHNVDDIAGQTEPTSACADCLVIGDGYDFCKIELPMGRLCRGTKTLEVNELIRRACLRQYDDFFIIGGERGISADVPFEQFADNGMLVEQSAVRRQLQNLAIYFQDYMARLIWSGDPANNSAGGAYKEPYGLTTLVNGDYPASGLDLESMDGNTSDCAALNSRICDFNATLGDGAENIYEALSGLEMSLYQRAQHTNLLPVRWIIVMHPSTWDCLVNALPCDMAQPWCAMPSGVTQNIDLNSGTNLFYLAMREQVAQTMTLRLNGRMYNVVIDDATPYTIDGTSGALEADIWFLPLTVRGRNVLTIQHMDYSRLGAELALVPGSLRDAAGWTDGGRFHLTWNYRNWCFNIQMKTEWRIKLLTPQLAGRVTNVGCLVEECNVFQPSYWGPGHVRSGELSGVLPAVN